MILEQKKNVYLIPKMEFMTIGGILINFLQFITSSLCDFLTSVHEH